MITLRVMYQIKNMKKLFILLLFVIFGQVGFTQVYQLMPQYGYQALRMSFDSTLQIPTTCGVPTLKSVYNVKRGAIAFDSCNNRFYTYNPANATWSFLGSGGTTDTTSLSNRINQRIDSLKRSGDSVFARKNGVFVFQYKDSVGGGGSQNLQQVTNVGNTTTNEIKTTDASFGVFKTDINVIDGTEYYPLLFQNELYLPNIDTFYIKTYRNGEFNPIIKGKAGGGASPYKEFSISPDTIFLKNTDYNVTYILPQTISATAHTNYLPSPLGGGTSNYDNPFGQATDTLATLQSLRRLKNVIDSTSLISYGSVYDTAGVVVARVRNIEATTLQRGEVVYIYGSTGNTASVKRANNKQDSTSSKTFGIVRDAIAVGDTGIVVTQGQIGKLNLSSFSEGDILWLDSLNGQVTSTKPQAPYHQVFIGVVERANNGNGLMYVKIQNGLEIDELHNVKINGLSNNQILAYNDTNDLWVNRSVFSIIDTSIFQRKSVASYTFKANNTSGTANATDQVFKDLGNQNYTGTITWTGTTAPSGTTNHKFRFVQIGKQVTITISLNYGTAGSALTAVKLTLPSDCPSPTNFGTLTGANDVIGSAWAFLGTSTTAATTGRVLLQNNAANNGFEFNISAASGAYRTSGFTLTYFTD